MLPQSHCCVCIPETADSAFQPVTDRGSVGETCLNNHHFAILFENGKDITYYTQKTLDYQSRQFINNAAQYFHIKAHTSRQSKSPEQSLQLSFVFSWNNNQNAYKGTTLNQLTTYDCQCQICGELNIDQNSCMYEKQAAIIFILWLMQHIVDRKGPGTSCSESFQKNSPYKEQY